MENRGCGIICEYNPFHKGHAYQLSKAKEICEFTVCAMSGDFVQRGEEAFQDKKVRAKNAMTNGADIVLEIPFPYSCFGAEGFARKGVEILSASGLCSHLLFGSECDNVNVLTDIANCMSDASFYGKVLEEQKKEKSLSFARARQALIEKTMGADYASVLDNPNDILGVEYIKSIKALGSKLIPVTLKRSTPRGGFDDTFASSSYIRGALSADERDEFALSRLPENYDFGGIYKGKDEFFRSVHLAMMMKKPQELENILEVPQGYGHVIVKAAHGTKDFDELCSAVSGKTMTVSKAKRMLLFAFFGIEKNVYHEKAAYSFVLALSKLGSGMLKKYREESKIILASRAKDIKDSEEAQRQFDRSLLAGKVLEKCGIHL